MFMHVDINSAYCAFEQVFSPDLANHPLVIVGNNDSSLVAINAHAKKVGLKRGMPIFKCQDIIKTHNVAVRSANFTLYGDYSNRFHELLSNYAYASDRYSVDESFLLMSGMDKLVDFQQYGQTVRESLKSNLSLTCGVGVAKTKTLAKLATYASKRWVKTGGIVVLTDPQRIKRLLSLVECSVIWGIGKKLSERLASYGIMTAEQFSSCDTRFIRKKFGVTLERTQRELRNEVCFRLHDAPPVRQQIVISRSFGQRLTELQQLHEAVSFFTARAAEQLRLDGSYTRQVMVFIQSSAYASGSDKYSNCGIESITATHDTRDLINAACLILQRLFRPGIAYAKAGVMLSSMTDGTEQLSLFDERPVRKGSESLMKTIDRINQQQRGAVFILGEGIEQPFRMKQLMLSPRYTTRWDELLVIKA